MEQEPAQLDKQDQPAGRQRRKVKAVQCRGSQGAKASQAGLSPGNNGEVRNNFCQGCQANDQRTEQALRAQNSEEVHRRKEKHDKSPYPVSHRAAHSQRVAIAVAKEQSG